METDRILVAGGVSSKVMLILWMPTEDPSSLASWAHLVAIRRFLQGRGIRVTRCFSNLRPPDSPRPNLLRVFARRDGVPVERYGPLRGFRGLGILPIGSEEEREHLCSAVSAVLQDFGFLGVLATIRQLAEDPDEDYPFGFAATESYREYLERHEEFLVDSDGRSWSDEEIEEYKRWRTEPGDRCLELIEGELFPPR